MKTPSDDFPPFDEVFADLEDLLVLASIAFDNGTAHAREYFESRGHAIEPELGAMLTRSIVKELLEERFTKEIEEIWNLGLGLSLGHYRIKIWKTTDGHIPPPGQSRPKRAFLAQQLSFQGLGKAVNHNIVLMWQVNPRFELSDLYLALPNDPSALLFGQTEVRWRERIDPFSLIPPVPTTISDDADEPLDFEFEKDDQQAAGDANATP